MFKSVLKLNSLLSEIKTIINSINSLDNTIEELESNISIESNLLKQEMSTYIDALKSKTNSLNILNNERSKFANSENFINFSNDVNLSSNNGLNLDTLSRFLISETTDIISYNDFSVDYDEKENIFSITFETEKVLNNLIFSFYNENGNVTIPVDIFFNNDYRNIFYRSWMDKMSKVDLDNNYVNRYYFEPTFTKTLHFKFDEKIDITRALINMNKLTYNNVGQAIYNFPCPVKNGFTLNKLDFVENIGINYSYSLDNSQYTNIKTTNNNGEDIDYGTVLFGETTTENTNLYIKIERDNSVLRNLGNTTLVSSTNIVTNTDRKITDISFNLSSDELGDDYSIVVDNSLFELYQNSIPDYFQKTTDGLVEINKKYVKEENNISALKLLSLRNQNTVGSINSSSYIYKTDENVFYFPLILASSNFSFVFDTYEESEILKSEDYTPLVFEFSINYTDGD